MKHAFRAGISFFLLAGAASAQTPAGGELRVNTYTTGRQTVPRVAMEPDGDFVVVWESYQDGYGYGIFAQRFAAAGTPRGGEFRVNTNTLGQQRGSSVAVGRKGDFVVVWTSVEGASVRAIRGQRFDGAGTAVGGEFAVSSQTTGVIFADVGRAADGRFVVAWSGANHDGNGFGMAARRFDPSGNPVGAELVVNTYTTGDQVAGTIDVAANGSFIVAWEDTVVRDSSGSAIFAQRYDAQGVRLAPEFRVNTYVMGKQRVPSVRSSPAGGFVVAFKSEFGDGSLYGVFARRFDAAGAGLGNDFVVNTYTTGFQTGYFQQLATDAQGNFVIAWASTNPPAGNIALQRFSASGARRGAELAVNAPTTDHFSAAAASDEVGNIVIASVSVGQDGSLDGVYVQRYGGLGPAALSVDNAGNQVLEPGETVAVRPTWRNFNGAAQTFAGALGAVTGPAGATYTTTDGIGNYGAVNDGASAQCTDCYAVSVSNPPARPATHWDASAVESILPDTQGQQKQWLLHVGGSFTDVPTTSGFYRFVETLLHHGVTSGCGATTYCPAASTTREQMAVFVLVAREGPGYLPPACTTPIFTDVPSASPFCRWIEELARRGVAGGCGPGTYCPSLPVVRDQMSVFVLRMVDPALNPPACTTPIFPDVPASSPFCRWVEELVRRGVVSGCGGGNYCPTASVTREQMGVFISVTFGLALYGP